MEVIKSIYPPEIWFRDLILHLSTPVKKLIDQFNDLVNY